MCRSATGRALRAQAAVELLAYAAFFLFIFITAVSIFTLMQSQESVRAENAYAQQIAYGFANQIQTAFIAGPGFSQSIDVPPDILGKPYVIWVSRKQDASSSQTGFVYLNWKSQSGGSFSAPTITSNYSALTQAGHIWIEGGDLIAINSSIGKLNISNVGGSIYFRKG